MLAHLVGWSDGGILGANDRDRRPDLVANLVAIGANYDPSGMVQELQEMFARTAPDSAEMATLRGPYEMHSPDGPEHWPIVFDKFVELIRLEPNISLEELGRISARTLVLVGDDDFVSWSTPPRCSGPSRTRSSR